MGRQHGRSPKARTRTRAHASHWGVDAFVREGPVLAEKSTAFEQALGRFGWVEGKNIQIDYRFTAGDPALFKTYAAELVGLMPDAILTSTTPGLAALRQQTGTIPIVFVLVADPVGQGFVQSLARPGGNITGFSSFDPALMGKWLQLLKEVAPGLTRVSAIFNPDTTPYAFFNRGMEPGGTSLGTTVTPAPVHDDVAIEEAIATLARQPGGGLICLPDSFTTAHRAVIISAAIRQRLPLMGAGDPFCQGRRADVLLDRPSRPVCSGSILH